MGQGKDQEMDRADRDYRDFLFRLAMELDEELLKVEEGETITFPVSFVKEIVNDLRKVAVK